MDLDLDFSAAAADLRMRRLIRGVPCTYREGRWTHQEGHVHLERLVEHAVDALLDELPVRDDNLAAVALF